MKRAVFYSSLVMVILSTICPAAIAGGNAWKVRKAVSEQRRKNAASLIQVAFRASRHPEGEVSNLNFTAQELSQSAVDPEYSKDDGSRIAEAQRLTLNEVLKMPLTEQIDNLLYALWGETTIRPKHMRTLGRPASASEFLVEDSRFYRGSPASILKDGIEKSKSSRASALGAHRAVAEYYLNRMKAISLELGWEADEIYSPDFITRIQIYALEEKAQNLPLSGRSFSMMEGQIDLLFYRLPTYQEPKHSPEGNQDLSALGFPAKDAKFLTQTDKWLNTYQPTYKRVYQGSPAQMLEDALKAHERSNDPLFAFHSAIARYYLRAMKDIAKQMGMPESAIYSDDFIRQLSEMLPEQMGALAAPSSDLN